MRILTLLLLFGLWPGAAEAVVDLGHLVREGHDAHGTACVVASTNHADDHDDATNDDEHHCTATFHLCGGHTPTLTSPHATTASLFVPGRSTAPLPLDVDVHVVGDLVGAADGAASRMTRPPIA